MKKIILMSLIFSILSIGYGYLYFHVIHKENVFADWYEPFSYILAVLVSIVVAIQINNLNNRDK